MGVVIEICIKNTPGVELERTPLIYIYIYIIVLLGCRLEANVKGP
jgi:hypothetical protein